MIISESMAEYLARPAVSASFLIDMISECPAYAWARSPMSPDGIRPTPTDRMEFGTIAHLAILEEAEFDRQVDIVTCRDWRAKAAQELREQIRANGKLPLTLPDADKIIALRRALEQSEAAPYLFGEGQSEVTYTWLIDFHVECKARIDRLAKMPLSGATTRSMLVHLKTSQSANPQAFAHVAARLGYDVAAAWYMDGWLEQPESSAWDSYVFVVVSSEEPHMVSLVQFDPDELDAARDSMRRALAEYRAGLASGTWRGYGREPGIQLMRLPAWHRRRMTDDEGANRG